MENERALGPFAQTDHFDEKSLEKITSDIEPNCSMSRANLTNLKDYMKIYPTARTPAMSTALKDLEFLHGKIEDYQKCTYVLIE